MHNEYPIIDVTSWPAEQDEPMGTKEKVWLRDHQSGKRWLFKHNRLIDREAKVYAGEDWSEKIASELAEVLGIPHASVDLAKRKDIRGVISLDFIGDRRSRFLFHGNELLGEIWPTYPREQKRQVSLHTVKRVLSLLAQTDVFHPSGLNLPTNIDSAADVFVAYLMLDALIGNTDRHHGNWAVVGQLETDNDIKVEIAPTFDHASSLSRELTDDSRRMGFSGEKESRSVEGYCSRCRSAFYRNDEDSKPLSPIEAFKLAAQGHTTGAQAWLKRLEEVSDTQLDDIVRRVPSERMSSLAKNYVLLMLESNRRILIES